uniref:G-protein coupled receptors family 1 profile domain-containing protein n=1 Tax=Clytia hemisphaerica TaxID=252671 RepID=A0A7M5X3L2_9CNID
MNNTGSEPPVLTDILSIGAIILGSIISITILITNSCLLFGFWKSRCGKKQITIVFLVPFICTHWFIGIGSFAQTPGLVIINATYRQVVLFNDFAGIYFRVVIAINFSLLIMLLIDRMLAVKKPFVYQNFTKGKAYKILPAALIFPAFYLLALLLVDFEKSATICSFSYFFTGFILIAGNIAIFLDVHKQLKQIHHLTISTHIPCTNTTKDDGQPLNKKQQNLAQIFKKKLLKSVLVSMMFTLTFVILWLPTCILTITEFIQGRYTGKIPTAPNPELTGSLLSLGILNSVTDPIIYVVLNRPVRRALMKTFKCFKSTNDDFLSTSTTKSTSSYRV